MHCSNNDWRRMEKNSRNFRLGFVKRLPLFILFVVIISMLTTKMYAQTDSVRWSLTSTINPDIFGNLAAGVEIYSNLAHRSYNGGVCEKTAPTSAGDWPADVGEVSTRYVQFGVSPISGFNFNVSSVRFFIGWAGTTGHIFANVYYSTSPTFATRTQLGGVITLQNTVGVFTSFPLSIPVPDGSTFYVRVYPWDDASATGKSLGLFDVAILGSTSGGSSASLTVNPTALTFSTIAVNTSQDFPYALAGSQLSPSSGSITVTAPTGFTVSTTNGSGYTSSLDVSYTGGTLGSTTIYTRFTPTSATTYSGIITNIGGGATTQNVSVSGSGTAIIPGIFVSLTGSDSNPGTYDQPYLTIPKAVSVAHAGDTIFVRSGRYPLSSTISILTSGTSSSRCCLYGYPGDPTRPILDFSAMAFNSNNRGIILSGQYWHIKGLEIYRAGDNGMNISGSFNIIEFCALYENQDAGMQLGGGASNNQIINCDSYYNYDAPNNGGNADGFAPKLDVGTGNYFYGCRSWQNSDDGWDGYMRPSDNITTTLENCWSFKNGFLKDGTQDPGNGNGFKMGGGDTTNIDSLRHNMILKNCLCFDNKAKGFDQNNNRGSMTLLNCTGYRNGTYNFSVPGFIRVGSTLTIKNCVTMASSGVTLSGVPSRVLATNSWPDNATYPTSVTSATSADFLSIDTSGVRGPRKPDGSLPDVNFMHLASGSHFIDAGTNVGIPYNGTAPDLGAFESNYSSSNSSITIATSPAGQQLTIDGSSYTSPQTFSWSSGSSHTIGVSSPQGSSGTQYVFTTWSDAGSQTHTITVPASNTTYTANFVTQYQLTVVSNSISGGNTAPNGQSWQNSGTIVALTATQNLGYHFTGWSGTGNGSYSGTNNPASVTINGPIRDTANFAINVYTITAAAGANGTVTPAGVTTVNYNGSQNYTIAPATGYHVADVLVDGSTVGGVSSYNFTNVTVNHTISASFALSIPEIPVATAATNIDSMSYTAHWNASTGATSYQLDVASDSLFNIPIIGYIGLSVTGTSQVITGLVPDMVYYYRLRATNAAGSSSNSNTITVRTTSSIRQVIILPVRTGWNFVSVPLVQPDYTASTVFTGMYGSMFGFDPGTNSYVETVILEPGHGYWVYYTSAISVTLNGSAPGPIVLPCAAGWNLLGSGNIPVAVSALQVSGGEIYGSVFRYNALSGSYEETLVITPGEAHWVYVTQPCAITIP
jgi:hypothetical protein